MFECSLWAFTHVISGLQKKFRTDLRIVSSGTSFLDSVQRHFISVTFCDFGFSFQLLQLLKHGSMHARGSRRGSGLGCLATRSPCQWSLGSACRAIPFGQLRNSFLKVVFPSIWPTPSKYSIKQHICAKLYAKQMSNISCKNIHAFLRYSDFRVGTFYFASPRTLFRLVCCRVLRRQRTRSW